MVYHSQYNERMVREIISVVGDEVYGKVIKCPWNKEWEGRVDTCEFDGFVSNVNQKWYIDEASMIGNILSHYPELS